MNADPLGLNPEFARQLAMRMAASPLGQRVGQFVSQRVAPVVQKAGQSVLRGGQRGLDFMKDKFGGGGSGGKSPLVYGPSERGLLRQFANRLGGETLNDIAMKYPPMNGDWNRISEQALTEALKTRRSIVFDLTNMKNIPEVLNGTFKPDATTSFELRYLQEHWSTGFDRLVRFYQNGRFVKPPWQN